MMFLGVVVHGAFYNQNVEMTGHITEKDLSYKL